MPRRKAPEINSGSTADIAFLLLIFFLVTTTMDVDTGIAGKLPPMPEEQQLKVDLDIKKRNVCVVLINSHDRILFRNSPIEVGNLREATKEFIKNEFDDNNLPEKELVYVNELDKSIEVPKGVVSLQNDRGTSYGMYIMVRNEIVAAYNEVRNEAAMEYFGLQKFDELTQSQKEAIKTIYPQRISEAEPKNIGGK